MGWTRTLLGIFSVATFVTGCAATTSPTSLLRGRPAVRSHIISTSSVEPPVRPDDCYVDMVFDRNPVRPYVVIGRVSSSWVGTGEHGLDGSDRDVLDPLRAEACRAGGHVVFQYQSSYDDDWLSIPRGESVSIMGFVRRIRSTALVAVYVTRDGSVMQAPSGARRVIRIPASLPGEAEGPDASGHPAWEQGITDPWAVPAP